MGRGRAALEKTRTEHARVETKISRIQEETRILKHKLGVVKKNHEEAKKRLAEQHREMKKTMQHLVTASYSAHSKVSEIEAELKRIVKKTEMANTKSKKQCSESLYGRPKGSRWCILCERWKVVVEDGSCRKCSDRRQRAYEKAYGKEETSS